MFKNTKYKWKGKFNCSIFDIVSKDGAMKYSDIYHVVEQLCLLPEIKNVDDVSKISKFIHPKNIIVNNDGSVFLKKENIPISLREFYIPPEQDVHCSSIVYALGILMLFMATENVKKSDIDVFIDDSVFKSIVEHCIAFDPKDRYKTTAELLKNIKKAKRNIVKNKKVFTQIVVLLFFVGLGFYFYRNGLIFGKLKGLDLGYENGYIVGYEKGFTDAPGIGINGSEFNFDNGNLFGNMNYEKGAITAFSENELFFVYENTIYRMNTYKEDVEKLVNDVNAYGLNYYDGCLYYSTDENIYRFSLKTMKPEVFLESRNGLLYIVDNEFYLNDLFNTGYLYRVNKDTKELTQLNGMTKYNNLNIVDNKLYFIDTNKNSSIYSCDLDGGNLKLINSNSFDSFSTYGNKIYAYVKSFKGDKIDYSMSFLISMDLDGGNIESLTNVPAYNINVTDDGIYYISGNNKVLKWMSSDGKIQYTISSSPTEKFNIAGRWIFYINEEDNSLWRVSVDGFKNRKVSY